MTTPAQEFDQYAPWVSAMSRALDHGDRDGFRTALAAFDQSRNAEVTQQVRRIAIDLHGALERFRICAYGRRPTLAAARLRLCNWR